MFSRISILVLLCLLNHTLFSILLRRPPRRPPPFPYTTLFRSGNRPDCSGDDGEGAAVHRVPGGLLRSQPPDLLERALAQAMQDRKSTRLNSSHVSLSYAVFCSKKKYRR